MYKFKEIHLPIKNEEERIAFKTAIEQQIQHLMRTCPDMASPYKSVLEDLQTYRPEISLMGGFLSCAKFALKNAGNEICTKLFERADYLESQAEEITIGKALEVGTYCNIKPNEV